MEKEISAARVWQLQITVVIVSMLGVLLIWPLDQVRAASAVLVLTPDEILDDGQAGLISDRVTYGPYSAPYLDPMDLRSKRFVFNQYGLHTMLSGAQRGEGYDPLVTPHLGAITSEERNPSKTQGEVTASRTAKVLDLDVHRNGISGLREVNPASDQGYARDRAAGSNAFFEFGDHQFQVIDSNVVGPPRLSKRPRRLEGSFPRELRSPSRKARGYQGEEEAQDQAQQPQTAQDRAHDRPVRALFGGAGRRPLGTEIAIWVIFAVLAWLLIARVGWIFGGPPRQRRPVEIAACILGAGAIFTAPIWLNWGF